MKFTMLNTAYKVEDLIIESTDEIAWSKIIQIIGKADNKEEIIDKVKDQNLGTIYKITEI